MAAPTYEILTVPAPGEDGRDTLRQQCYDVRIDVFHREQGFPLETEIDEYVVTVLVYPLDETGTHILLRLTPSLKPVGTIRVSKGRDYYKLSRLAVLQGYRHFRFGRKLVESVSDWVREDARNAGLSVAKIRLHSQLYVKPFYAKFGYEPVGDEFDEDGAPHQLMVCTLQID
ncbi:acyl-CoA N-acyltransferase [Cytidiella melzeri]|nr:acyl-CoA N-acyltransferase [Cytidiella melzeri]